MVPVSQAVGASRKPEAITLLAPWAIAAGQTLPVRRVSQPLARESFNEPQKMRAAPINWTTASGTSGSSVG